METFIGIELVQAKPMLLSEYNDSNNLPQIQDDEAGYLVSRLSEESPVWVSKQVFDSIYCSVPDTAIEKTVKALKSVANFNDTSEDDLSFGKAIDALKQGKKVARRGWNGKNMFLYLQPASIVDKEDLRHPAINQWAKSNDMNKVQICSHIDMKAADDTLVIGWLASQTDMLSNDWFTI